MNFKEKYIAPSSFYKNVASIAVPLALQQMLSSCMGIVDTLMVSWIGMVSAVGTATQIETIANTVSFGTVCGTGIFCAQYYGANDEKNLKRSFGLSLMLSAVVATIFFTITTLFGPKILKFFLDDPKIIKYGMEYLKISKYSFFPAMLAFCFNYVYRTIHKAKLSLIVTMISMGTNVLFNYLLIFGKFGFPEMGVAGAALGTVIAQCVALTVHIVYAIKTKQLFIGKPSEMFNFDFEFVGRVMKRITPMIFNELLFGLGNTLFIKAFGTLGSDAMDAYYVAIKISDVFFFVIMGISNANTVITGHALGSGDIKKAKQEGNYFIGLAAVLAVIMSIGIVIFAKPMVMLFNLQDPKVFVTAVRIVRVFSLKISLRLFIVIVFGALRAGGDSKVLTLLDSGILWTIGLPAAFLCVKVLGIKDIALVFVIIQIEQVVRMILGLIRYKSYKWAVNLTR